METSSKVDIDQLAAAADAQNWNLLVHRPAQPFPFQLVSRLIAAPAGGRIAEQNPKQIDDDSENKIDRKLYLFFGLQPNGAQRLLPVATGINIGTPGKH